MKPTTISITVFRQSDGTWGYCPTAALANPSIARAFRYSDKPGFPSSRDALNAIRRDKTIPLTADVLVEAESFTLPFLEQAKAAFASLTDPDATIIPGGQ